jgi:hypothetical protein
MILFQFKGRVIDWIWFTCLVVMLTLASLLWPAQPR